MDENNKHAETPLVSIIVPVYNTEEYLEECLNCLVNQTIKNIEIICIDDASTDDSLKILNLYAKSDDRIIVLNNETNIGQSTTRNLAIEKAKGEYITFFDSDDVIDTTAYEKLYNEAKEHDQDIIIFSFKRFNQDGEEWFEILQEKSNITEYIEKTNIIEKPELIYNTIACNKFIKKDFLKKINLKFMENTLFEDIPFSTKLFCSTDSIGIYPDVIYYWRVRDQSTTQTNDNIKNLKDRIFVSKDILDYVNKEENEKFKPLTEPIYKKLLEHDFPIYLNQLDISNEEYEKIMLNEVLPFIKTFSMESIDSLDGMLKIKYELLFDKNIENLKIIAAYERSNDNRIKEVKTKIKEKNEKIKELRIQKEEIRARKEEIRARKEEIRIRKEEIRKEKNAEIRRLKKINKKQRKEIKELKSTKGWVKYKTNNLYERGKNKFHITTKFLKN